MEDLTDYRKQFVAGSWRPGTGGTFTSIDPYTEEPWAELTSASTEDVDEAIRGGNDAFPAWRITPGLERAELLLALADAIERDVDELAEIETRDNGKILRENANQLRFAARNYRFHAGLADKVVGETKPLDRYDTFNYTTREPLGVVALITAWNSPLQTLSNKLAPALAAGNCVLIKPSEHASVSSLRFAALMEQVGFPPGVVSVLTGAAETGQAITSHRNLAKISFTGGAATATRISMNAAPALVPATFELGGKSANIIFPDADLARAIPGAVSGVFAAAGQTCVAGSRLLVHNDIYDEVVQAVAKRAEQVRLGNPMDSDTQMGPIAYREQYDRILELVQRAIDDGAKLVTGGEPDATQPSGLFVLPTVLGDVEPGSTIEQTEVFGPVLAVQRFETEEDAIRIANGTDYGLAAGIWTKDINRAHTLSRELECGTVWVNTYRTSAAQAPFGGVKRSGYGRERGTEGFEEYTRVKNTMIDLSEAVRDPFVLGT